MNASNKYIEGETLVLAKPKSGYFLTQQYASDQPKKARLPNKPIAVSRQQLIEDVFKSIHQSHNLALGVANPVGALPITKTLNRTMRRVMSVMGDKDLHYGAVAGYEPLRRQLAFSYMEYALPLAPDEFIITNGAQEALNIALQCVAKAGDVIAVESPCYFGILELIENLGMLALEVPICSEDGLTLQDVKKAINKDKCTHYSKCRDPIGFAFCTSEESLPRHAKRFEVYFDHVCKGVGFGAAKPILELFKTFRNVKRSKNPVPKSKDQPKVSVEMLFVNGMVSLVLRRAN